MLATFSGFEAWCVNRKDPTREKNSSQIKKTSTVPIKSLVGRHVFFALDVG